MQRLFFLFALFITMQASAADTVRCGTDAFGNAVCMDKNGVVSPAPVKPAGDQSGGTADGKSSAGGSAGESGNKPGNEDQTGKMRCGIDPFGNKVCQ
jgi:hypothetical protein